LKIKETLFDFTTLILFLLFFHKRFFDGRKKSIDARPFHVCGPTIDKQTHFPSPRMALRGANNSQTNIELGWRMGQAIVGAGGVWWRVISSARIWRPQTYLSNPAALGPYICALFCYTRARRKISDGDRAAPKTSNDRDLTNEK
jgi:hypothetical protein